MSIAVLLMLAAAPDIILTRRQAEHMTSEQLAVTLLAAFPHREITAAAIGSSREFPNQPLDTIQFAERAQPSGGNYCSARRIVVQFDTLDGKVARDVAFATRDAPRRMFSLNVTPLLAILDRSATVSGCAAVTRFAQLPWRQPDRARQMVERLRALSLEARRTSRIGVTVRCRDERVDPAAACDGRRVLASLDWSHLGNVWLPAAGQQGVPVLEFYGDNLSLLVRGDDRIAALEIVRRYPAPF